MDSIHDPYDRVVYARTVKEAANEGYRHGFQQGYETGRLIIEAIAEDMRAHNGGKETAADAILKAFDLSKDKVIETFCHQDDAYTVEKAHPSMGNGSTTTQ
jgi:hypothetical protein